MLKIDLFSMDWSKGFKRKVASNIISCGLVNLNAFLSGALAVQNYHKTKTIAQVLIALLL